MRQLRILAVGRLKTPHWRDAAAHYLKRLPRSLAVEELTVKDADAALALERRKELEASRLLKLLRPADAPICLDEHGRSMASVEFSRFLERLYQEARVPCFLVGGAWGLAQSVIGRAELSLSLGAMTYPHELARVLLLEQIYRAENIMAGTGYHH